MEKDQILEYLKTILPSAKLPDRISFKTADDCLFIKLGGRGVIANMQTDESAFEGWAIVLKSALPCINKVVLDWDSPMFIADKKNAQQAHYNRFLMRVANFKQAYSWFNVSNEWVSEVNKMQELLESNTIVVNFPQKHCSPVTDPDKKQEAVLERKLVELWEKDCPITDEQLPVGLFRNGKVSKENTLTPSGASQIDLWQLDNDTMRIYELKVKGNEAVGIISELMFYVCTIKNIVDGHIKYTDIDRIKSYRHFKDFANAVANKKIKNIIGYFTAPRLHPLLDSPKLKDKIIEILNANDFGIRFEFYNISHPTE
jgi:hypothetical protein